jgi:hypothetical protein
MKAILTIILFSLVLYTFPQEIKPVKNQLSDSLACKTLKSEVVSLMWKIDSLNSRLNKYEMNVNYFSTALSSQTAIFSIIVTVMTLLIGFISYNKFKAEVKAVTEKYEQSIENYNKIKENLDETDSDLYTSIAVLYINSGLYGKAIFYCLRGVSRCTLKNTKKKIIIDNIHLISQWVESKLNKKQVDGLIEDKDDIMKYINKIVQIEDYDIQNEISKLRIVLIEKLNNA